MKLVNQSACLFSLIIFSTNMVQADVAKGKEIFTQRCVTCHGAEGAGDGPVGMALPPESKPRNLKEFKVKFASDDAKFKELLKKGGAGVGLSPIMPPQTDLSEADMDSVIQFVHSLKK